MKLSDLVGQVVELRIRFPGGFGDIFGRVIESGDSLWVGEFCFYEDAELDRMTDDGTVHYIVDTKSVSV